MKLIDKSNGYIFAGIEASAVEFSKIAVGPIDWDYYRYPFNIFFPPPPASIALILMMLHLHMSC